MEAQPERAIEAYLLQYNADTVFGIVFSVESYHIAVLLFLMSWAALLNCKTSTKICLNLPALFSAL